MKKTICLFLLLISLVLSLIAPVSASAAETTYSPSDYYAVVDKINKQYDVSISIQSFAENVSKTPEDLYHELEALVLRTKANEAKKQLILHSKNSKSSSLSPIYRQVFSTERYYEELTKSSNKDSMFDITVLAEYYWNTVQEAYYFRGGSDVEVSTKDAYLGNFFFFADDSGCEVWDGGRTLFAWATGDILYLSDGFGWYNYYDVTESVDFGYNRLTVNN